MYVQQYGLQRTGTNAVRALIEHNCAGVSVSSADKHHVAEFSCAADGYLVSLKDPVSWTWSNYTWRRMKYSNYTPVREIFFNAAFVDECLEHWRERTLSYLDVAARYPDRTVCIQHEYLLADPGAVLAHVCEVFGLHLKREKPELFLNGYASRDDGRTRSGSGLIDFTRRVDRDYHLQAHWVREIPEDLLQRCFEGAHRLFREYPVLAETISLEHFPTRERIAQWQSCL